MTAAGKAVVFISHKLGEVMDVSDRVTVMRNGRVTGAVRTADTTAGEAARMMVGRDVDLSPRRGSAPPGRPLLRLTGVSYVEGEQRGSTTSRSRSRGRDRRRRRSRG